MLKEVPRTHLEVQAFRLVSDRNVERACAEYGLSAQETEEVFRFLGPEYASHQDILNSLLASPFKPRHLLQIAPTRFSDGSIRVSYSALEKETAEAEVISWTTRSATEGVTKSVTLHYNFLAFRFAGEHKDLRGYIKDFPLLIASPPSGYEFCNQIGAEAKAEGLDALLTLSARRELGNCLPVFALASLSQPQLEEEVVLQYDPQLGTYQKLR